MDPATLRILSYNLHAGVGLDGRLDVGRLAEVIARSRPDLVAVQEVDRGTRRSQAADQLALLEQGTGMPAVFGKTIDHDGGDYGVALLSRWPLSDVRKHFLPTLPDEEKRIALAAKVNPGAGWPELLLVGTHLSWSPPESIWEQTVQLNEWFASPGSDYRILAGDFNATPDTSPLQELRKSWSDGEAGGATFPADEPTRKIDYVMVGPGLTLLSTEVINEPVASDHRPVLSVIGLV